MQTTETLSQKSLAGWLDRAAARADMIDRDPATGKQCWYLAHLILKSGEDGYDWVNSNTVLTKREASNLIDTYLN